MMKNLCAWWCVLVFQFVPYCVCKKVTPAAFVKYIKLL